MSSLEDDSINGSILNDLEEQPIVQEPKKPMALKDRILDYALHTTRPTRDSIATYISGSGSAGTIVSGFIREGIFKEKHYDCGNCVYFEVDKTKVHLE